MVTRRDARRPSLRRRVRSSVPETANDFIWGNDAAVDAVDFSIDEATLYVGTPPAGPVGD
jgi:hypothetical protein